MNSIHRKLIGFVAAAVLAGGMQASQAAKKKESKKAKAADELFDSTKVIEIDVEIPPEGIATLEKYQFQFGAENQPERESVPCTVREGGRTYTNVAVHLKGAAGSFRPVTENPALTLNFDKFADKQNFHGLTKLSLNNSVQDQTLCSEQFCRELFLKAGVPVPRATEAKVRLNGRDLGVYVLVEGFNKQFLKRHFDKADGHLYDGGFVKDITSPLAVNSGDDSDEQSDRIALADAASEPDLAKRAARLEKVLDMDRFLTYVALDIMLWDWDGYPLNRNNWRLFHDTSTDKMVFIPHGLDQMFWKPKGSIFPPMKGLVAKAVLQVPELRARYFEKMKELRASVFNVEQMTNRMNEIAAKTNPILQEKDSDRAKAQSKAVAEFCDAIALRAKSIDEQLSVPITPVQFDSSGSTILSQWESKADFGHPEMKRESGSNGGTLDIDTTRGSSIGSWRSRVWLEGGHYRLEARLKTRGIVADLGDSRAGAGLRIGSDRPSKYVAGDSDWSDVSQEFSIDDGLREVQILCEFRGAKGEASFQSVRLVRIPSKNP
jgi:hypothetical protein